MLAVGRENVSTFYCGGVWKKSEGYAAGLLVNPQVIDGMDEGVELIS